MKCQQATAIVKVTTGKRGTRTAWKVLDRCGRATRLTKDHGHKCKAGHVKYYLDFGTLKFV